VRPPLFGPRAPAISVSDPPTNTFAGLIEIESIVAHWLVAAWTEIVPDSGVAPEQAKATGTDVV